MTTRPLVPSAGAWGDVVRFSTRAPSVSVEPTSRGSLFRKTRSVVRVQKPRAENVTVNRAHVSDWSATWREAHGTLRERKSRGVCKPPEGRVRSELLTERVSGVPGARPQESLGR